jgi:signal recognition particle receptor subunit beta
MAYLNVKERMLEAKIVYYGAGLSGKTTNLELIKQRTQEGRCGDMMSLNTAGDRTLFFDWLPFNMGKVNGCDVKMQLYTVPGQGRYAETRRRVLAGADGIVLVLDSQSGALDKNREILADLREHMRINRLSPDRVPIVFQLNKRDLPSAMAPAELLEALGLAEKPYIEAVASVGKGVFETLQEITRLVLASVRDQARSPGATVIQSGTNSNLDGHTLYSQLTASGTPLPGAETPEDGRPRSGAFPTSPEVETRALAANDTPPPLPPTITPPPAALLGALQQSQSAPVARQASPAAPSPAPLQAPASARDSSAAQPARAASAAPPRPAVAPAPAPESRPVSSPEALPSTPLNEVISVLRTLGRRVDALEPSLLQKVTALLADQRRGAAQSQDEVAQRVAQLAARVDELQQALALRLDERGAALQQTLLGAAGEQAEAARLADQRVESLLGALREQVDALRLRLEEHEQQLQAEQSSLAQSLQQRFEAHSQASSDALQAQHLALDEQVKALQAAVGADIEKFNTTLDRVVRELEGSPRLLGELGEQIAARASEQVSEQLAEWTEALRGAMDARVARLEEAVRAGAEGMVGLREQARGLQEQTVELQGRVSGFKEQLAGELSGFKEQLAGELSGLKEQLAGELSGVGGQLVGKMEVQGSALRQALEVQEEKSRERAEEAQRRREEEGERLRSELAAAKQEQAAQLRGLEGRLEGLERRLEAAGERSKAEQAALVKQVAELVERQLGGQLEGLWGRLEGRLKAGEDRQREEQQTRLEQLLRSGEARSQEALDSVRREVSAAWMVLDGRLGNMERMAQTSEATLQMLEEKQPRLEQFLRTTDQAVGDALRVLRGADQRLQESADASARVSEVAAELTRTIGEERARTEGAIGRIEALRDPMTGATQALLGGARDIEAVKAATGAMTGATGAMANATGAMTGATGAMTSATGSMTSALGAMTSATGAMRGSEKTMAAAAVAMGEAARAMGEAAKASGEATRVASEAARANGEGVRAIDGRIAEQEKWLRVLKEQLLLVEKNTQQALGKLGTLEQVAQGIQGQSRATGEALVSLQDGSKALLAASHTHLDATRGVVNSAREALGQRLGDLGGNLAALAEDLRKTLKETIQTLIVEIAAVKGVVDGRVVDLAKQGELRSLALREQLEKRLQALDVKVVAAPELQRLLTGTTGAIVAECNATTNAARDALRILQEEAQNTTLTLLREVRQGQGGVEQRLHRVEQGVTEAHGAIDRRIQGVAELQGAIDRRIQGVTEAHGALDRKISAALVNLQEQLSQQQQGNGAQLRQVDEQLRQLLELLRQAAEKKGWWRA